MAIKFYNSLSKKTEVFKPLNSGHATIYSCGPTVYDYAHIGNFRAFMLADELFRIMKFNGYDVKFIMNLTDVGHLTDDADEGDDKVENTAEREGKSAREISDFYIKHFLLDYEKLNLSRPQKFTRATDYIKEQIDLVVSLQKRGYTYKTSDGIYFDTSKFTNYGVLSGLTNDNTEREERIEGNTEKRNPSDFALWKFSPQNKKRWQEWESPWGLGYPGWHIECSAMSMKELGATIDIHTGGEDHKMIHHPNEIAQSEGATGQQFVNYWLHNAFLQVDGGKMAKSLGNIYTITDVENKKVDPLALRYFYMSAHYRSPLNFTWGALQSADNALKKLYSVVEGYRDTQNSTIDKQTMEAFLAAINDDLNMPKALAVVWDMLKGNLDEGTKLITLLKFDEVLGLKIDRHIGLEIPKEINDLALTRKEYRKASIWDKADLLRRQIEAKGYIVEDVGEGFKLRRKLQ